MNAKPDFFRNHWQELNLLPVWISDLKERNIIGTEQITQPTLEIKEPKQMPEEDDEDDHLDFILTSSGNLEAHDVSQINGSSAGHWNPLSVINIYTQSDGFRFMFII